MSAKIRDYYAEEVEFLTSLGVSRYDIAARFGIKPGSLARALARQGRHDLAAPFWAINQRDPARWMLCACGTPCQRTSGRCAHCAYSAGQRARWARVREGLTA